MGNLRRLSGNLDRSASILSVEAEIYDKLPTVKDMPKIDIMELYAGHADVTFLAHQYGLRAMEPYDLLYGKDMNKQKDRLSWRTAQKTYRPLLAMVETECADWNIFNENLSYKGKDRMDELVYKRQLQYPLVKEGVQSRHQQIKDANLFLFENPAQSRI